MIAERVADDNRAVASASESVVRFCRVLERWRITSLMSHLGPRSQLLVRRTSTAITRSDPAGVLAWISLFILVCAVGGVPKGPARPVDDHVSQTGELATMPVRRCEEPALDAGPDDDSSTKAPHDDAAWGENVGRPVPWVAPLMSERPDLARIGPSSPRGPPLLV